jgi:acyl carrier protein/pimeloyl-ACP methyl ester carboxylesterase
VPPGEQGELYIGGVGLARGYLSDPSRTAAQFFTKDDQRWYKSGDVAWKDYDGDVHCLGRLDDQIKIRGVRIEPGEVEVALLAYPAITGCIVTWYTNPAGLNSLGAAVVVARDQSFRDEELSAWLSARLVSQMVPSRWLRLESLPLTASGKADRHALRDRFESAQDADISVDERSATAFTSDVEANVARIWGSILGQPVLSREDHFFSVGGDSLAAVRMIARLESTFDVVLGTQSAFEAPTIKRLAALIEHVKAQGRDDLNREFVFPLAEQGHGLPLFFCEPNMHMASDGRWRVPCSLFAIATWAQGAGFLRAISLEALARVQLAAVRRHQPVGPYRLGGGSFGGLIALEMAQQLLQQGEEVELLFLLDPLTPSRIVDEAIAVTHHSSVHLWCKNTLWRLARNKPARQRLLYAVAHLFDRKTSPMSAALLPEDQWPALWYQAKDLAMNYVARPYSGRSLAVFSRLGAERDSWNTVLTAATALLGVDAASDRWDEEPAMGQWMTGLREAILSLE